MKTLTGCILAVLVCSCLSSAKTQNGYNSTYINLSSKTLAYVPDSVFKNTHLKELRLGVTSAILYPFGGGESRGHNELKYLTDSICMLKELRRLDISFNHIDSLPSCFYTLQNLEFLNISCNVNFDIRKAMPQLLQLNKLKELNMYGIISVYNDTAWIRAQLASRIPKLTLDKEDMFRNYSN